jgi:transcriptional antiterminator RfaH
MPLLSPEPSLHPEDLFAQPPSIEDEARWWVLHTRARAEKTIARTAARHKISFFLPLYEHRWRKSGRAFSSCLPLFPGYVFIQGDFDARRKLLETNAVANILHVVDQQQLQTDLARVYNLLALGLPVEPQEGLVPGARVIIIAGPMKGFEGKVIRRGGRSKLVLEVNFIRLGVAAEVEDWMVKPLIAQETAAL